MERRRVVFLVRRFWPWVGGPQNVMANLGAELIGRGWEVTILTARWQAEWPGRIRFRGIPVVRLPHPPQGRLGMWHYLRDIRQWLRDHAGQYDLVYASTLRQEARAAVGAVRRQVPVVLRAEKAGRRGDCLWQIETREGRRIKQACMRAAGWIAPGRAIERELQAAGYPRQRIHLIPDGVPVLEPRNVQTKEKARAALAEVNASLSMPSHSPLAVYAGCLDSQQRLAYLVAAWSSIVRRWPNARLWLAGHGSQREALTHQIEALNLSGRVIPLGTFDEIDELLAAADLFISPAPRTEVSAALLEAMGTGLPIVATDTPGNREAITDGQEGLLVGEADAEALAGAVTRLLDRPDQAAEMGDHARRRVAEEFSLAKMVDRHVTWFQSLLAPDSPSPKTPSMV